MDDALSKAKNELKDEVKRLALTLSKIETFSGLIALEPKIDRIKEHLTVLKYLENSPTLLQEGPLTKENDNQHLNISESTDHYIIESNINKIVYRPVRIDLNDKIAFVKELFAGDSTAFDRMMTDLNQSDTLKTAKRYVKKWTSGQHQPEKEPYLKRLTVLVKQRFNE